MKTLVYLIAIISCCMIVSCSNNDTTCQQGASNPDCICTAEFNPVCGCNEATYNNACEALCDGIEDYTLGACP